MLLRSRAGVGRRLSAVRCLSSVLGGGLERASPVNALFVFVILIFEKVG
jgi:hypothetical protein